MPTQTRATPAARSALDRFNAAPPGEAVRTLLHCLHSPRWARRVAAHRPYPDLPALLAAADEAAYDLTGEDLAEALAAETLPGLPEDIYAVAGTALRAAHAAYATKFGHVFVICLDGVPRSETLDHALTAIRSRLANDPEREREVTAEELRRLARERLSHAVGARGTARPATPHPNPANKTSPPPP
ncbi:2-oxo-4-hydroxy-4-carboxy-5-ureidoimidazoline decarboxylase [Streptomyces fumanus]|uniref:2-oxo-4-hydroxy-4-carboxy-5-ureidoimidazoline decarboxylase n=1 Tax=Streptomyces fumanus TaxID=67302 RepID=A0A919E4H9_9ACTN|nr:2-oxo-4-hydroxy-4-carboxy-5-ureidoimidazoline decarboxylase [Streptomyces fumanus]GHF13111.1 2-oxo-4-hydroxy-4-carboxy-5-ureidoimidazoline decarboxylase [Streptomyces fumanus]